MVTKKDLKQQVELKLHNQNNLSAFQAKGVLFIQERGEKLSNLEEKMKEVAAALTGKKADEIPGNLEDICSFIAENYQTSDSTSKVPFNQVEAPEAVTAAPTQNDFNGLIEKLKAAKIFI